MMEFIKRIGYQTIIFHVLGYLCMISALLLIQTDLAKLIEIYREPSMDIISEPQHAYVWYASLSIGVRFVHIVMIALLLFTRIHKKALWTGFLLIYLIYSFLHYKYMTDSQVISLETIMPYVYMFVTFTVAFIVLNFLSDDLNQMIKYIIAGLLIALFIANIIVTHINDVTINGMEETYYNAFTYLIFLFGFGFMKVEQ